MNKQTQEFLNESKFKDLIFSDKYKELSDIEAINMNRLLENMYQDNDNANAFNTYSKMRMNESTLAGDVAQFTPILMPLVRRVYPQLIANEILGVQTMSMPTGYIYALVNQYVGDGNTSQIDPNNKGIIVRCDVEPDDLSIGDTVNTDSEVVYIEGKYVLLKRGDTEFEVGTTQIGSTAVCEAIYSNEASFNRILKNYSGPYTTAAAEQLGTDMMEMGFTIQKKTIEAQSRALKSQYTVEMYQDLKSQHGLLADEELMSLMAYEIQAQIDRECVALVNDHATILEDTTFPGSTLADYSYGRWEIERYRAACIRIAKEAAMVGLETKRGQANILLVSPKVATMLEQVGTFKPALPDGARIVPPTSGGVAGYFDNRFKVIVDQYAMDDYCTVLYKGTDNRDAMGFFAPYIPLSFTKVVHQDSGQPAVIAKCRYALATIPGITSGDADDRAAQYARSFGVDFTNTVLYN